MKKKGKIAIIFYANLFDCKGLTNAVLSRIKYLKEVADYQVDAYSLKPNSFGLSKIIWGASTNIEDEYVESQGIRINLLRYKRFAIDNLLSHRLHKKPFFEPIYIKRFSSIFRDYDLISAHSFLGGLLALSVKHKYNIPYFVTWHGSDIHSIHFKDSFVLNTTASIINNSECNFFVSRALAKSAKKIVLDLKWDILYNGVDSGFYKYENALKIKTRQRLGVSDKKKVVAFVGNLFSIKNVEILPTIFNEVKHNYEGEVLFWIVGDGELKNNVEKELLKLDIDYHFWGNLTRDLMPDIMNCIDVLVLPSINEGLGLVLLEAISCGANAVGSNVGGIPEILNEEDVFDLNEQFVENISKRIVYMLEHEVEQKIKPEFNWSFTAQKEDSIYKKLLP